VRRSTENGNHISVCACIKQSNFGCHFLYGHLNTSDKDPERTLLAYPVDTDTHEG